MKRYSPVGDQKPSFAQVVARSRILEAMLAASQVVRTGREGQGGGRIAASLLGPQPPVALEDQRSVDTDAALARDVFERDLAAASAGGEFSAISRKKSIVDSGRRCG